MKSKYTNNGLLIKEYNDKEKRKIQSELKVRPIVKGNFGVRPPSFNIYKNTEEGIIVPKFYAHEKLKLDCL